MSEWPDHADELARKAMEEVRRRVDQHETGKLSLNGLWHVLDTLSEVTQGMIPAGDWQLIYDLRQNVSKEIKNARNHSG